MSEDYSQLPRFLRDAHEKRRGHIRAVPTGGIQAPGEASAYARAAFDAEVTGMASQTEPGRNDRLNVAAFNLAQLVASGHLRLDETWSALELAAVSTGLTQTEVRATLRSAFRAGTGLPRQVPEQTHEAAPEASVVDRPGNHPAVPPQTVVEAVAALTDPAAPGSEGSEDVEPPSLVERFPRIDWAALWADETEEEWVIEPLIPARRLVALYSPPKVGKSLLMLELAVAVSRGVEILGYTPDRPRRVLYVDFENDPRGDVRQRLKAMALTPDDLGELVYLSFPRLAYLDTYAGGLELAAVAAEYDVELVVIDTISRAVGGEENDNDTWLGFYRHTGLALKAAGIACVRLDHTGKDATKGMRGGSAKYGDVDAVWSMTCPTEGVLQLECVANRLPIEEKQLTLRRDRLPKLQHVVTTEGRQLVAEGRLEHAVGLIDAAFGKDEEVSRGAIQKTLQSRDEGARWAFCQSVYEARALRWNGTSGGLL